MNIQLPKTYRRTLESLKQKIQQARLKAVLSANVQLLATYWEIGQAIAQQEKKQGWGAKIVDQLAKDLKAAFPDFKGLSSRNLRYMRDFTIAWPELSVLQDKDMHSILQQPAAKLPWFHICTLLDKIKDSSERDFYAAKAVENGWSRNVLVHQIESGLHKRHGKALTNFADTLPADKSELVNELFKDPYKFDFLQLTETAKERDLENALVEHIMKFMLEMGKGFAFVGRQVQIDVGDNEQYLDLLLYHLKLHCYVVLELKIGEFKPEYAGKMNFYLSAIDSHFKTATDAPSIGLILCKNKDKVTVEYALKDVNKPMGVSAYQITHNIPQKLRSQLPSIEDLEQELIKEIPFVKSNQKKREQMGSLLSQLSPEFRKEKSMPALNELWNQISYKLQPAIKDKFIPERELFEHIIVSRFIDGKNAELGIGHFGVDLTINTKMISLLLRMSTLKKAGSKAFSISKYLDIRLKSFQYTLSHKSTTWVTKQYHEFFSEDEIDKISERLLNLVLTEINKKLHQIVKQSSGMQ